MLSPPSRLPRVLIEIASPSCPSSSHILASEEDTLQLRDDEGNRPSLCPQLAPPSPGKDDPISPSCPSAPNMGLCVVCVAEICCCCPRRDARRMCVLTPLLDWGRPSSSSSSPSSVRPRRIDASRFPKRVRPRHCSARSRDGGGRSGRYPGWQAGYILGLGLLTRSPRRRCIAIVGTNA
jgi:hypothetical protein